MYVFGRRFWSFLEDSDREEIAKKLIFLIKTLNMRNSVCPEENALKTSKVEDLLFLVIFFIPES